MGTCVEVGKFGLEEEVERLKRDKNVLMQELVRLRQQQQATDNQLQTMVQRLQGMEQRQQQMMSFLAKAVQSPGFLAQFVQQQGDSNRRLSEANKKRRLKQEGVSDSGNSSAPDGQIVRYQPVANDAAHAMLRQLRKIDGNLDSSSDSFYFGKSSPTGGAMENDSPTNWASGVTLQEVPATSGVVHIPVAIPSEPKSSPVSSETVSTSKFRETNELTTAMAVPSVTLPQTDAVIADISPMAADISRVDYLVSDKGDDEFMDLASVGLNGTIPDTDIESLLDDSTWEQFLDHDVIPMGDEEADLPFVESLTNGKEGQPLENGWKDNRNMDKLTAQMGLLNSDNKLV